MDNTKNCLIEKFNNKSAIIGIIGLGYVGLPLMLRYADVGFKVLGFDIDADKVNSIQNGESYIAHISSESISQHINQTIEATVDFERVCEVDAIILCVPTPLNKYREPDLSYIIQTMDAISGYLRLGQIVCLESTTYPGTTEEELKPRIEQHDLTIGKDVFLVYSPEREDPANPTHITATIPKVCGGYSDDCLEVGLALYKQAINQVVPVSSLKTAEMTKLLENIHRSVNIGLANEMKIVAKKMGVDIHEVVDAAATKPFGFVPYYPGPGIGGHCIPIDPFYLTWKSREYGLHTRFIELAGEINGAMPQWVVNQVTASLNDHGKAIRGSRILVLGIAYKKNVDDMRESPAIPIIESLLQKGGLIDYHDPHIPAFPKLRECDLSMECIELSQSQLSTYDCALLITDHSSVDYELIKNNCKLIIDTRGVYREKADNVVQA